MKKYLLKFLIFSIFILNGMETFTAIEGNDGKFRVGKNMKYSQEVKLDINLASRGDILATGLSSGYVDKIIDYREVTGGFLQLNELKRISGITEKNYKKISENLIIDSVVKKEKLLINQSDEKTLKYFGISPKNIKKIMKNREKDIYVNNNLELKSILTSEKLYTELRDEVDYTL